MVTRSSRVLVTETVITAVVFETALQLLLNPPPLPLPCLSLDHAQPIASLVSHSKHGYDSCPKPPPLRPP